MIDFARILSYSGVQFEKGVKDKVGFFIDFNVNLINSLYSFTF